MIVSFRKQHICQEIFIIFAVMITYFIAILSILALVVDRYIYRRVIRRHNFGRVWNVGYVIYALIVDMSVLASLIAYKSASAKESVVLMQFIMCMIFLFFLNIMPKLVYTFVSLFDYAVRAFTHRRSHLFGRIGTVLALVVAAVMLWGATVGRSSIEVRRVAISSDRLPRSFDGFRIVQFSDTHLGTMIGADAAMKRMVDTINSLNADMVVQSGDLVNITSTELTDHLASTLSKIESRYGVFSVLGNHDLGFYIPETSPVTPAQSVIELSLKQRAMGWNLLINESVHIHNETDSISVSGVNFPAEYKHNGHDSGMSGVDLKQTYANVNDSTFNILVSHAPQLWNDILQRAGCDLMLAGHVHAMQMKFGIGGWLWSPAMLMYDRWSGLYHENGKHLYINDGMGYVMYPMRIGTRPEVTLIELRSTAVN